jgi:hypothetical protein
VKLIAGGGEVIDIAANATVQPDVEAVKVGSQASVGQPPFVHCVAPLLRAIQSLVYVMPHAQTGAYKKEHIATGL